MKPYKGKLKIKYARILWPPEDRRPICDDPAIWENMAALFLSITKNMTPEQAFIKAGEEIHRKWYTDEDVADMKRLYATTKLSYKKIGLIYSMDESTVFKLIKDLPFTRGYGKVVEKRKQALEAKAMEAKAIEERALRVANYIIESKCSTRKAAEQLGLSITTTYEDATTRIKRINPELAAKVGEVIRTHKRASAV